MLQGTPGCWRFNQSDEHKGILFSENEIWDKIQRILQSSCISLSSSDFKFELQDGNITTDSGMVSYHGYALLETRQVKLHNGQSEKLFKIRNTWGSFEWKGDWSDKSKKWNENPELKVQLNLVDRDDGTFW
eukprot:CAMPEP_0116976404 /NCGR_PEP_ID=MMETSP0467-20121206/56459_1 /TAXON_ID=283647 /ORGANISM="Mesodinium pulex, Strain SPMC105" /LENGTH=130 /DNA_ID=CAMNT_0004669163 /DNA_START=797 /DNA_END=1186 /DNA_ORIENTATION=-